MARKGECRRRARRGAVIRIASCGRIRSPQGSDRRASLHGRLHEISRHDGSASRVTLAQDHRSRAAVKSPAPMLNAAACSTTTRCGPSKPRSTISFGNTVRRPGGSWFASVDSFTLLSRSTATTEQPALPARRGRPGTKPETGPLARQARSRRKPTTAPKAIVNRTAIEPASGTDEAWLVNLSVKFPEEDTTVGSSELTR